MTLLLQREYGLSIGQTGVRRLLKAMNLPKIPARKIVQSFSGKGCPFDNAVVEAFLEETNRRVYSNLTDLHLSLFEYIESFYNDKRPHSAINFLSPNAFEYIFSILSDFMYTLLTTIQYCVEKLEIVDSDVPALFRQIFFYSLILFLCELHDCSLPVSFSFCHSVNTP